jgi:hypothetical protein
VGVCFRSGSGGVFGPVFDLGKGVVSGIEGQTIGPRGYPEDFGIRCENTAQFVESRGSEFGRIARADYHATGSSIDLCLSRSATETLQSRSSLWSGCAKR